MKKTAILLYSFFLFSLFSIQLYAQNEAWRKYNGALLWKISGKDTKSASYILGTHHLMPSEFAESINGLKAAINESEQAVGELDLKDIPAMAQQVQMAAMMPSGEDYDTLLSEEDYQRLDEGLKSVLGAGLDNLKVIKPAMLSTLVSITIYTKSNPTQVAQQEGMDLYVQRILKEKGKQTIGLETVEEQLETLFETDPIKKQAESLVCTVSNKEYLETSFRLLNEYYIKADLVKMYDLSYNDKEIPCKMSEAQKEALLKKRNDKWLAKIPEIIREKSSLIAVGALHLTGEEGLLYQLAQRGYTVEAIK